MLIIYFTISLDFSDMLIYVTIHDRKKEFLRIGGGIRLGIGEKEATRLIHTNRRDGRVVSFLRKKSQSNGVTRQLYSKEWQAAQQAVEKKRMEEAGLRAYYDDVGNLFGRLAGRQENASTIFDRISY
ncbi:hypothetical protein GCM10020331_054060 [Ectobacillus funiculus]